MLPVTHNVPIAQFPGRTLDGFFIESILGRGGMAAVFRARDLSLDRTVALKVVLSQAVRDDATRQRFLAEARLAANVQHPNIMQTWRAGEQDGVMYIALQYVQGRTLEKILRNDGPMPWKRAIAIAREISRALAAAHDAGLVHRDIKPANVMIGPDGHVTVMDFGVAKPVRGEVVDAREFSGTPEYASPEQHRGEAVDPRADLYALGVTLYQMLTGKIPFVAESRSELAQRIAAGGPIPVRDLAPSVPRRVEDLVESMMHPDPARRPATARDAEQQLHLAARGTSLRSPVAAVTAALLVAVAAYGAQKIREWRPTELETAVPATVHGSAPAPADPAPDEPVPARPWTDLPAILVADVSPLAHADDLPAALSDLLSRTLADSGKVRVLPRSRAALDLCFAENRLAAAAAAARTHGARFVVTGEYTRRGDRLEISLELVRIGADGPTSTVHYARGEVGEIPALAAALAESVEREVAARDDKGGS
jgi:tRNA A-37 threonylcarbamoyl transferase component Bud32/TolB-like protein